MHQICLILKQFIIVHKTQSNLQQHKVTGKTKIIVEDQQGWDVYAKILCWLKEDENRKVDKQAGYESLVFPTRGVPASSGGNEGLASPIFSFGVWSWLRHSVCAAICFQQVEKFNTCTHKSLYKLEIWLCLSFCLLACLFSYHLSFFVLFCLDAIFCLFCLCSLSPLPYFLFSSTLFSLQVLVCLRDCTPCLASFQASGCFNAPISLLSWLIQSEKRRGGEGADSSGQKFLTRFYWETEW